MLWSSVLLLPVGLTDHWFIPQYWHPITTINFVRVSPESFLFCFAIGGIAAVGYELLLNRRIRKTVKKPRIIHWLLPILILASGFYTSIFFNLNFMSDTLIAMSVGAIYLLIIRFDLIKEMFMGGVVFALIYIITFAIALKFDPNFVNQWSLANLSGRFILEIPAEEIYWAFLFGAVWAVVFEDIRDYKSVKAPCPELENVSEKKLV